MPAPAPAPIPSPAPKPGGPNPYLGKTIARCVVGERIGRGASSSVFRAKYVPLQKDIALKILSLKNAEAAEMRERFREEAKSIAKLDHESIVKVIDVAEDQGFLCILMEYVPGETVQDRLDDVKVLPPKKAIEICAGVARALENAHDAGIIHRDIKPANMMLSKGSDLPKVVDFGLASKGASNRVGTPLYMSPEASQGKRIDEKSDVYALGVSLYQMLTGRHPFTGDTVKEILQAQVSTEFVPVSKVKPELGNKYDDLLKKLLVKSKGYRPTASEAAEMLEEFLDAPAAGSGGGATGARRGGKSTRRSSKSGGGPMIAVALLVIVLIVVAVMAMKKEEPPPAPPPVKKDPVVVVDPKAAAEAAAKAAYDAADLWVSSHPNDPEGQVQQWAQAEKLCVGTDWLEKVKARKLEADRAAGRKKQEAEMAAATQRARETQAAEAKKKLEEFNTLVAACDFEAASAKGAKMSAPEGFSDKGWRARQARLKFLTETFADNLDGWAKSRTPDAATFDKKAAQDEVVTGADKKGFITNKSRTIPWGAIPAEDLFHSAVKKSVSQSRSEGVLFLAVAATELGLKDQAKMFRESLSLVDSSGTATQQARDLFE